MARAAAAPPLTVAMNGRKVGELRREPSGAVRFTYAAEWLAWDFAFPISLSLPLKATAYHGAPVIAVFDNLLPDEAFIRARVAEKVGAAGVDPFSLLAAIGRDCVGALQFLPPDEAPAPPGPPEGEPMSEAEVAVLLENLAAAPLGLEEDEAFRISLAGAQEKTALLRMDGAWLRPRGATPTTHILKPAIGQVGPVDLTRSVENEYLCMKLAASFGLPTAKVEIGRFGEHQVLIVERFDRQRRGDGALIRLPQEDFCQALGVSAARKYESAGGPGAAAILDVLGGSDDPLADRQAFLKAQALFWLLGATDGHAKNFSLALRPDGYRLAPLYDIVSLQPAVDAGQISHGKFKLSMAMGAKRHYVVGTIQPRHFVQTGKLGGLRGRFALAVLADVAERAPAAVAAVLDALPRTFPADVADPIVGGLKARLERLRQYLATEAQADYS